MAHIFIIIIFFSFSVSLNAASIKQVFGGNEPVSDSTSSQPGTKAETLFGNSSTSSAKKVEPAKETKQVTTEEAKEETKSSTRHRAAAVFGRSSDTRSVESSDTGGRSKASAVFGSRRSSRPQAVNTSEEKEGQNRVNEAPEHENPRLAPKYMWPVAGGKIVSFYGWRSSRRFHDGIDISAPSGTKIFASKSGEVIYSGNRIRGYGNMVVIRHNAGYSTVYAHNKTNLVNKGDIVRQGDIIAYVGSTGHASGPHSHFEVRKGKYSADPLKYISSYDVKKHSGVYANSADNSFKGGLNDE